jgi:hypothetical protein
VSIRNDFEVDVIEEQAARGNQLIGERAFDPVLPTSTAVDRQHALSANRDFTAKGLSCSLACGLRQDQTQIR